MEILNICKDTRLAENVKCGNTFGVQRDDWGSRGYFLIVRSFWCGEEIEGDDEDEHDWGSRGYFLIVLVVVVVLGRPGAANKPRATTSTSTIGEVAGIS